MSSIRRLLACAVRIRFCARWSIAHAVVRRVFFQRMVFYAVSRDQLFRAIFFFADFLISGHLGEGLVQLLSDGLELVLLAHQLVLQPVNLHTRIHQKREKTLQRSALIIRQNRFHWATCAQRTNGSSHYMYGPNGTLEFFFRATCWLIIITWNRAFRNCTIVALST